MPPETGWRVEEGWMGLAGDDEGVWVGWGRKGEVGVIRAEVGVKDGIPCESLDFAVVIRCFQTKLMIQFYELRRCHRYQYCHLRQSH